MFRWWATVTEAALVLALALALALLARRDSRDGRDRGDIRRTREWQVAAALALVALFAMLIAWQAEGQEVTRHMLEGSVQLRLGVLAAMALGVGSTQERTWGDIGL